MLHCIARTLELLLRLRAHELSEERRLQRQRRRELWFASYGIDLDTRDIHSLGVS